MQVDADDAWVGVSSMKVAVFPMIVSVPLTAAPGCGKGASARLSPVARPPTKLTPVNIPLSAARSSNQDPFTTESLLSRLIWTNHATRNP